MGARSLTRDLEHNWIGGVCAGISARYGWNVTLVRAAFVVLAPFGGFAIALYVALWLLLPPAGHAESGTMETAREGAEEIAEVTRVATNRIVEAARTAADEIAGAARSTARQHEAPSSTEPGDASPPRPEEPERPQNGPAGPIP